MMSLELAARLNGGALLVDAENSELIVIKVIASMLQLVVPWLVRLTLRVLFVPMVTGPKFRASGLTLRSHAAVTTTPVPSSLMLVIGVFGSVLAICRTALSAPMSEGV